jgi:hypothetical protein
MDLGIEWIGLSRLTEGDDGFAQPALVGEHHCHASMGGCLLCALSGYQSTYRHAMPKRFFISPVSIALPHCT